MPYPLSDVTDVATAGTAVQISNTPRRVLSITFVAPADNAGTVYVGNDSAADVSVTTGIPLAPQQFFTWEPARFGISIPISDWWVDANISGDKVAWGAVMFT